MRYKISKNCRGNLFHLKIISANVRQSSMASLQYHMALFSLYFESQNGRNFIVSLARKLFFNFVTFLLDEKFSHGSYFVFCSVAPKLSKNIIFESFEGRQRNSNSH